jgi:hypothetical protein
MTVAEILVGSKASEELDERDDAAIHGVFIARATIIIALL